MSANYTGSPAAGAPLLDRRRFIAISAGLAAGLAATLLGGPAHAAGVTRWRGTALGAGASITLRHSEAERIVAACVAEIDRLEDIFSLHRPGSALSRLNAAGRLGEPPFEMLELLGLCGAINAGTAGLFDPTVQPLWAAYAEAHAAGAPLTDRRIEAARARVGWSGVEVGARAVRFRRSGMAITLNGIAQGFIADRVVALLRAEGLTDVLVDTGELHALGFHPGGSPWRVTLDDGLGRVGEVALTDMALASSAPLGTVFDAAGRTGHILHPVTGRPAAPGWRLVSVLAPSAALADGLTTAMCLMTRGEIDRTLARFPTVRLAYLG
ncbi:MAG TPA: FAD:protein FMN transferase [Methylomirabilota bacterium]|nr:FAD:protein FMN transferase [Methylomirabilota bacterium]